MCHGTCAPVWLSVFRRMFARYLPGEVRLFLPQLASHFNDAPLGHSEVTVSKELGLVPSLCKSYWCANNRWNIQTATVANIDEMGNKP